jgi:hypothetical protein
MFWNNIDSDMSAAKRITRHLYGTVIKSPRVLSEHVRDIFSRAALGAIAKRFATSARLFSDTRS